MSRDHTRETMRAMALFESLRDRELALLAAVMIPVHAPAGEVICREGEPGTCCYFVVDGEVEVRKHMQGEADRTIATLRRDQVFGHIALVDPGPRSASCIARTTATLLRLDRSDFETLFLSGTRFALQFQDMIARTAAQQLRAANQRLALLSLRGSPPSAERDAELREVQALLEKSNYR